MQRELLRVLALAVFVALAAFIIDLRERQRSDKLAVSVERLAMAIERLEAKEIRNVTTSWVSHGDPYSVTTPWQTGWTLTQWQDAHFAAVKTAQADHTPDR